MTRIVYVLLLALLIVVGGIFFARVQAPPALAQVPESTPLPLFALPDPTFIRAYSSSSLALAPDNLTLVAANMLSNTVSIAVPSSGRVLAEVPVGADPRGVAITNDGARAVATNRGDGTLSVIDVRAATVLNTIPVGMYPYGVVIDDNGLAYVSLQGSGEVVEVDLGRGAVTRRFAAPGFPSGLAVWGDFLYVTHFWTGEISLIYLPSGQVIERQSTGGMNGISQSITIDITRGIAYLPQTLSHTANPHLTYDSAVMPVVNVLNLRDLSVRRSARLALDRLDRPVNLPFALALDRFQERVYIVNAGSDTLSVIDLDDGRLRGHIRVGSSPRGVLLSRDSTMLYVHNVFDSTLTIIQTNNLSVVDILPISSVNVPTDQLIGARLFYSATDERLSRDGWLSCANCHFDGMSDGRVWQGFDGGPRNTPLLLRVADTPPYTWSAAWDELADIELKIRALQGGTGLTDLMLPNPPQGEPHRGLSVDLDTLVSYLASLQAPSVSRPPVLDAALVERGRAIYEEQSCSGCHGVPLYTNLQSEAVGTGSGDAEEYDTPSLRWLWLSAPYFHDGSAATLEEVFTRPGLHELVGRVSMTDLEALIAYLLTLPE